MKIRGPSQGPDLRTLYNCLFTLTRFQRGIKADDLKICFKYSASIMSMIMHTAFGPITARFEGTAQGFILYGYKHEPAG